MLTTHRSAPGRIGTLAADALRGELRLRPKPGLVSPGDRGSHGDMDASLLERSIDAIAPFFARFAAAGRDGARFDALRSIGLAAERAMSATTGGINTHRGAIFGLGLLTAASGTGDDGPLGDTVRRRWGEAIGHAAASRDSHGARAAAAHGVGGARGEAVAGFPSIHAVALPALHRVRRARADDEDAARTAALFALIAVVVDTNLLHRGGAAGLAWAQNEAARLLRTDAFGRADWRDAVAALGPAFVARRLSPGGSADLLAMALFVDALEADRR